MSELRPCSRTIVRPLSSISSLAYRLKCSRLHDNFDYVGTPDSGSPLVKDESVCSTESSKVVGESQQRYWNSLDLLPEFPNCENESNGDYCPLDMYGDSENWMRQSSPNTGTFPENNICLSASAPENAVRFQSINCHWLDSDSKSTEIRPSENNDFPIICHYCQDPLPAKRSCRSLSASSSSLKKPSRDNAIGTKGISSLNAADQIITTKLNRIVRPVALRHSQQCSLVTSGLNSPQFPACKQFQSACSPNSRSQLDPVALVRSGEVKLRNRVLIASHTSRLSWHHPLSSSCGPGSHPALSANQAHYAWKMSYRRELQQPTKSFLLMANTPGEFGSRPQNPPSIACLYSGSDYNSHRLSAFTPTNSRRISPHEGTQTSDFSCSPDVMSSPFQQIASSASSGFFQDSFSNSFTGSRLIEDSLALEQSEISQTATVQRNSKPSLLSDTFLEVNNRSQNTDFECSIPYAFNAVTRSNGDSCPNSMGGANTDHTPRLNLGSCRCRFHPIAYHQLSSLRCQSQPNAAESTADGTRPFSDCMNLPDFLLEHKGDINGLKRRRCCQTFYNAANSIQPVATDVFLPGANAPRLSTNGVFVFGSQVASIPQTHSESGTDTPIAEPCNHEGCLSASSNRTMKNPETFSVLECGLSMEADVSSSEWTKDTCLLSRIDNDVILTPDLESLSSLAEVHRCKDLIGLSEASEEDESTGVKVDINCLSVETRMSEIVSTPHHCFAAFRPISEVRRSPVAVQSCTVYRNCLTFDQSKPAYSSYLQCCGDGDCNEFAEISPQLSPSIERSPLMPRRGIPLSPEMQIDDSAKRFKELDISLIEQH